MNVFNFFLEVSKLIAETTEQYAILAVYIKEMLTRQKIKELIIVKDKRLGGVLIRDRHNGLQKTRDLLDIFEFW